jgi:membrane fusion protein (multidrug efflux system)
MRRIILVAVTVAVLACAFLIYKGYLPGTTAIQRFAAQIGLTSTPTAPPTGQASQQQQPPPEVAVLEVQPAEVPYPVEYAGRVTSFQSVEIRSQVGGTLLERTFAEGGRVKKGQTLFRIDPATYQVALDRVQAQLLQVQAAARQAEENYRRVQELQQRQVASERQQEEALAQRDQARANVQLAEAEIASARLNLNYTTITSPVEGSTSIQSPPIGTLVQAQQTLLTTVTQLDPAYVSFSFTEREGQAFRELNQRRAKPIAESDLAIELHYGNGTIYPQTGRIETAAQRVDPQTGTIEARAVFPNRDGTLLPGQFVRVVVRGVTLPDAIVIPTTAVSQGPQGPSVFVVAANGTAESRAVRLGVQIGNGWVVDSGLKAGDRVVVEGVIRVRPGAPVRPVPAKPIDVTGSTPPSGGQQQGNTQQGGARP